MKERFTGLIAATFTPMHADGSLWLEQVPAVVDYLHQSRISALYAVGSTGEGVSLSMGERKETADAFVRAARGKLPVLVQVGHTSLAEARELAAHAQQIGADAVSAVAPFYFKPGSPAVLADCMTEIAAGAPRLPFYYYHIPAVTGVALDLAAFVRLARERMPTFAGIKYTATTVNEFLACVEAGGDELDMFWGVDEMLLSGLAAGARGAVGSTYNYAPALYQKLLEAFDRGDLVSARKWQIRSIEMIRIVLAAGGLAAQKAMMRLCEVDCGPTRLPLRGLQDDAIGKMADALRAIGYFEWSQ